MKEKQSKKIFTRMLMNNWGGISHKVMEFHEYVNLFSGKSGSGKSTVMDAIQVVLYGSISSTFLNKAADDAKNRRSVLSYLRGAQKDGSFNREDQDFCSQIVLEIKDTGKNTHTCIGVSFEVGKADTDIRKYCFFSHSGKIPEDEYLTEEGVPYTIAKLKKLVEARIESADNRGRGDVNRVYPSKEAYLKTVYDAIFGYVEPGRMMTMEKSAIALRMTNGTGQFIKDYMFPKSKEDTVATISDQLGAYREIKERVEDLEQRIKMLDEISQHNLALQEARADKIYVERILKYIEIENCTFYNSMEAKKELPKVFRFDNAASTPPSPKSATMRNLIFSGPNKGKKMNSGNGAYDILNFSDNCYITSDLQEGNNRFEEITRIKQSSDDLFVDPLNGDFHIKPGAGFAGTGNAGDPRWY